MKILVRECKETEGYGFEINEFEYENVNKIIFGKDYNLSNELVDMFSIIFNQKKERVTFWQKNTEIVVIE